MRSVILTFACLLLVVPCQARTITVDDNEPADYNSIQEAIRNARDYDTIEVQPGTYNESINFYGKSITITGTDPNNLNTVYSTVIDGGSAESVVTFNNGEDNTSVLCGLTVQGGDRGIYCFYSDPLITKCVVRHANIYGIEGSSASPMIHETIVEENTGRGISGCDGNISNCKIINNTGFAGLAYCDGNIVGCIIRYTSWSGLHTGNGLAGCDGNIISCTISNNYNIGIYDCDARILNCIISGNRNYGVCISSSLEQTKIENCTIIGNKSSGVIITRPTIIANSIIVKNQDYGIINEYGVAGTLRYNNLWNNFKGNYYGVAPSTQSTK